MVNDEDKKVIQERAHKVLEVLSQLPMLEDDEARDAANLVYDYCRNATCHNEEEKAIFDEVFNNRMPITIGDQMAFKAAVEDDDDGTPKA